MRARAFTLAEVLVALALVLVLSGSVFQFARSMGDRRDGLVAAAGDLHAAATVIERLESDLLAALAGAGDGSAGVVGDTASLTVHARGVEVPEGFGEAGVLADWQATSYRFDADAGTLAMRRWTPTAESGRDEVVSARVRRMRLRYHDGVRWASSFDSASHGGLPVAVELALWFGEPARDEVTGEALVPTGPPDRLRVIVVPDGPVSGWKEGS